MDFERIEARGTDIAFSNGQLAGPRDESVPESEQAERTPDR